MTPVIIMVALSAEAQPLVASLGLRGNQQSQPFRSFHKDQCHLVVSGMGRVRAAAACGWAGAVVDQSAGSVRAPVCWINAGICGHGSRARGTPIRASSIHEDTGKLSFYPPDVFKSELPADRLITVDQPQRVYAANTAYDMEASAFWMTATRFSSSELMTTVKVVSDGPNDDLETLDRSQIVQLSEQLVTPVKSAIQALTVFATELGESPAIDESFARIVQRWHFSVSRQRQLRRLLSSLHVHDALPDAEHPTWTEKKNAQAVLDELSEQLRALPVRLDRSHFENPDCG